VTNEWMTVANAESNTIDVRPPRSNTGASQRGAKLAAFRNGAPAVVPRMEG